MSPQNHVATNAQHTNGFKLHFDMNSLKCVIPTLHTSIYVYRYEYKWNPTFPVNTILSIWSPHYIIYVEYISRCEFDQIIALYICTISYASLVFANFSNTFLKNTFPVHIYVDLTLEGRCIITNVYCCMIVMVSVFVKTEPYHVMIANKTLHIMMLYT